MKYHARPGETPLDDLSGLKLKIPNITRAQLDEEEAKNIQIALVKYAARKIKTFDPDFFSRLHRDMFSKIWAWAGTHRTHQTNIGSPPQRILQDLIVLQKDMDQWPLTLESGARLHHRAVQIHPFAGGNGRWSRLLSDLWLRQKAGIAVNWPVGMEKESPVRTQYLEALRAADGLDYGPLLKLYDSIVRN